jgi:cell fate regulator YaaT (PSP1 superfamily)
MHNRAEDLPNGQPCAGSSEKLEEIEDNDFEFYTDSVPEREAILSEEVRGEFKAGYLVPYGSCTDCAVGVVPLGAEFENVEAELDIVEVGFRLNRVGFYVNEAKFFLQPGTCVVVEAETGIDLGKVTLVGDKVKEKRRVRGIVGQPMRKILRVASGDDLNEEMNNRQAEADAAPVFKQLCKKHSLDLKLTGVEYQFDRSRITFYFTAAHRLDFRNLVRDLASVYHTRIELRQIGARDEAKKMGAIGVCGREVCCATWMCQIRRVTSDHARVQGITLNPRRLSGSCGKIKCCVLFEMQSYLEARRKFPSLNSVIDTEKGTGRIEKVDVLNDRIYLKYFNTGLVEALPLEKVEACLTIGQWHENLGVQR